MTTATATTVPTKPPLWPQPLPIIGGTGEKWSGKTLFGLSICPGPETLVYDFEQSSVSYGDIGFKRIDVQKEMHAKFPNGYKPIDLWTWWLAHIRSQPAGKYRVVMVDPVTDLERGLADWVAANPGFFGHTSGQYAKMSGIMWGDAKDYEKMILADITARCETFYFTAHIGREFKGNEATDKMKMKGKETLFELASLLLWFERKPDANGVLPNIPMAHVRKSRASVYGGFVDGEIVSHSVLPPKMPAATPKAIREYFKNPAGGRALKDGEKHVEEKLSDDEKLKLEVRRAEALRDAAVAGAANDAEQTAAESERERNTKDAGAFGEKLKAVKTHDDLEKVREELKARDFPNDVKKPLVAEYQVQLIRLDREKAEAQRQQEQQNETAATPLEPAAA